MASSELEDILIPGTDPAVVDAYLGYARTAREMSYGLDEPEIVVLDTETTGFDPGCESLIEIAAAICKGPQVVDRFQMFVNPGRHIPPEIVELTHITDEMVADAPNARSAALSLADFCGERDIIAHNAAFDERFVMSCVDRSELPGEWIDSLELARIALPRLRTHSLTALSAAFDTASSSHRATDDVEALAGVWRVILAGLDALPPGLLNLICQLREQVPWPARKVISYLAAADPDTRFSLREHRTRTVSASKRPAKVDAEECVGDYPTTRQVEKCFEPGGIVDSMYPAFERRDEQVVMASEVIEAFSTGTHRAVEAGTGVGKSIAYLVPAALTARKLGIGVGVATKTNALMDQLIYHELPALSKALGGGLSYVSLKGYEHYPCLHKLSRLAAGSTTFESEEDDVRSGALASRGGAGTGRDMGVRDLQQARGEIVMIAMLYTFIAQSTYCDLDSINLYWRGLPRERIVATSGECIHRHCPFYPNGCMIHGLRQRARSADIVVTNHALLFRDVVADGGILPPIRHWIIDEAHSAADEARKQLSPHLAAPDLFTTLSSLAQSRSSLVAAIRKQAKSMDGGTVILAQAALIEEEVRTVDALATSFFSFVKDLGEEAGRGGTYEYLDLWIDGRVRESGPWGAVFTTGRSLSDHLGKLASDCRGCAGLFDAEGAQTAEVKSELVALAGYIQEMRDALALMLDGEDEGYVYSASICRNPDKRREDLRSSLIDVGETLVSEFYPRTISVVYTSATIATGESFDYFLHSVGLDRIEDGSARTLQLASGYDYDNQMKVFVPDDVPAPNEPGYVDALEGLIGGIHEAVGGSTLTLFTNRREMEELYHRLAPRLEDEGVHLICQLKGLSAKRLRDEFLSDERTCLFALRSFWEGFDAPGDTLRCVIITRLPFSRPDDPLSLERNRRDPAAWGHYVLPEAILNLKQASGRLIRTSTDHGYLVIADSRLVTKRYGRAFLQALPSRNRHLESSHEICREIRSDSL